MLTRLKAQRARENKDCEMGKDWIDHGPAFRRDSQAGLLNDDDAKDGRFTRTRA